MTASRPSSAMAGVSTARPPSGRSTSLPISARDQPCLPRGRRESGEGRRGGGGEAWREHQHTRSITRGSAAVRGGLGDARGARAGDAGTRAREEEGGRGGGGGGAQGGHTPILLEA